jgi:hypothetical protein
MDIKNSELNYQLLIKVLSKTSTNELAEILFINKNTIQRWLELKNIPWQYHIDLKKILKENVDYSEMSFDTKDQFFTDEKLVNHCLLIVEKTLEKYGYKFDDFTFLEPSAGDGAFFNRLPHNDKIGLDIEPRNGEIVEFDFLDWKPDGLKKPILTIGNPPFGLRGNLALRFINHASKFSDFVCFILPPLFNSDGKGNCMNRVKNLNLIHSEKIDNMFYNPNGDKVNINVIFQIWSKNFSKTIEKKIPSDEYVKIYSLTDGGTPSTTRNKKMIGNCDIYLSSTTFEKSKMTYYDSFYDLPNQRGYGLKILKDYNRVYNLIKKIDWSKKSFLATNSSYNLRTSIIETALIDEGLFINIE